MTISYDSILPNIRQPGGYFEFNSDRAGVISSSFKLLVLGQRLSTGEAAANTPVRITNRNQPGRYFGYGSQLAEMLLAVLANDPGIELWAIAADDPPALSSTQAVYHIDISGVASATGRLRLAIAGKEVSYAITAGRTAAEMAAGLVTAINSVIDLPLTAAVHGSVNTRVVLTAKHRGECGNVDIRPYYIAGEAPVSPTLAITQQVAGSGAPSMDPLIAAMGDEWYNWIVGPWTDAVSMEALEAELLDRWGPYRQIGARMFTAVRGTHTAALAFGATRNSHLVSCFGAGECIEPAYLVAARVAAVVTRSLAIDPARPVHRMRIPGFKPPAPGARWTRAERESALYGGVSTYTVNDAGEASTQRIITMYRLNSAGLADAAYLDIETPETLERIRWLQRTRTLSKYARHKLADDGTLYGAGQAIVTPALIRAEYLALYREMEALGWVEDFEAYKATLIVERDINDRNRINVRDQPNLVNQFRVLASQAQFVV